MCNHHHYSFQVFFITLNCNSVPIKPLLPSTSFPQTLVITILFHMNLPVLGTTNKQTYMTFVLLCLVYLAWHIIFFWGVSWGSNSGHWANPQHQHIIFKVHSHVECVRITLLLKTECIDHTLLINSSFVRNLGYFYLLNDEHWYMKSVWVLDFPSLGYKPRSRIVESYSNSLIFWGTTTMVSTVVALFYIPQSNAPGF